VNANIGRKTSILIVDDDPGQRSMLREVLADEADELLVASSGEEALELLARRTCDLILLDMRMPGMGGLGVLTELAQRESAIPTVAMTAFAEVDDAVEAMKLGARDYLRKPVDLATLTTIIARHLDAPRPPASESSERELPDGFVFESPLMKDLLGELERVARSDVSVLLVGETGTGKEVLAQLIHRWGKRSSKPLVTVNVSALPEGLVESELFGHKKGAFTGASSDHVGRIQQAANGTLFLDEIGEMPSAIQPKLLRVLESGHIATLGGADTSVDFRLISATNRELEREVEEGRFRQDLYYRIAVIVIEVPPLRERAEDILPLAHSFLRAQGESPKVLSPSAEALLTAYAWPGNIRELRNAMLRAAILAPGDRILPEHFPPNLRAVEPVTETEDAASSQSLAAIERKAIMAALERCGGNRSQAARDLGISRRKLLYRLKEYGS